MSDFNRNNFNNITNKNDEFKRNKNKALNDKINEQSSKASFDNKSNDLDSNFDNTGEIGNNTNQNSNKSNSNDNSTNNNNNNNNNNNKNSNNNNVTQTNDSNNSDNEDKKDESNKDDKNNLGKDKDKSKNKKDKNKEDISQKKPSEKKDDNKDNKDNKQGKKTEKSKKIKKKLKNKEDDEGFNANNIPDSDDEKLKNAQRKQEEEENAKKTSFAIKKVASIVAHTATKLVAYFLKLMVFIFNLLMQLLPMIIGAIATVVSAIATLIANIIIGIIAGLTALIGAIGVTAFIVGVAVIAVVALIVFFVTRPPEAPIAEKNPCEDLIYYYDEFVDKINRGQFQFANLEKIFKYMYKAGYNNYAIAGMTGNWSHESGIDPTSVEGIFDEPYRIGKEKSKALINMNDYTTNILFPKLEESLSKKGLTLNKDAYKGLNRPQDYYVGLGLGQWTGGRSEALLFFAKTLFDTGYSWFEIETQLAFMLTNEIIEDGNGEKRLYGDGHRADQLKNWKDTYEEKIANPNTHWARVQEEYITKKGEYIYVGYNAGDFRKVGNTYIQGPIADCGVCTTCKYNQKLIADNPVMDITKLKTCPRTITSYDYVEKETPDGAYYAGFDFAKYWEGCPSTPSFNPDGSYSTVEDRKKIVGSLEYRGVKAMEQWIILDYNSSAWENEESDRAYIYTSREALFDQIAKVIEKATFDDIKEKKDECGNVVYEYDNTTIARASVSFAHENLNAGKLNDGTPMFRQVFRAIWGNSYALLPYYQSCDSGVSTAVRWGGGDDSFPFLGPSTQISHCQRNPDKYDIYYAGSWGFNDLQAGDILAQDYFDTDLGVPINHIVMFVGNDLIKEKFPNAPDNACIVSSSASGGDGGVASRSPSVENWSSSYYLNGHYMLIRLKKYEEDSKYKDIIVTNGVKGFGSQYVTEEESIPLYP